MPWKSGQELREGEGGAGSNSWLYFPLVFTGLLPTSPENVCTDIQTPQFTYSSSCHIFFPRLLQTAALGHLTTKCIWWRDLYMPQKGSHHLLVLWWLGCYLGRGRDLCVGTSWWLQTPHPTDWGMVRGEPEHSPPKDEPKVRASCVPQGNTVKHLAAHGTRKRKQTQHSLRKSQAPSLRVLCVRWKRQKEYEISMCHRVTICLDYSGTVSWEWGLLVLKLVKSWANWDVSIAM